MGFEVNRFANSGEINEDLICIICKGILEEGVWATTCEHVFCRVCITQWLMRRHLCPNDRQPLNLNVLKPIPRFMRNLLDKLEIKCEFVSDGCQQVFHLDSLRSHVTVCDFNPEKRVECLSGCGLIVKKADLQSHNCIISLRKYLNEENLKYEISLNKVKQELISLKAENKSNRSIINSLQNDVKRLVSDKHLTVISSAPSISQMSSTSISSISGSHRINDRCSGAPNPFVLITPLQSSSTLSAIDEPSSSTFSTDAGTRLRNEEPAYKRRTTTIRVANPLMHSSTLSHFQYPSSREEIVVSGSPSRFIPSDTTVSISNDSNSEDDLTAMISETNSHYINLDDPDLEDLENTETEVEDDLSIGIIEETSDWISD